MPVHGECAHYVNGVCTLYGVKMDPNAPACPNFKPRTTVGYSQPIRPYPQPYPTLGPYPGGRRMRHRRRHRHGRRWLL